MGSKVNPARVQFKPSLAGLLRRGQAQEDLSDGDYVVDWL